MKVLTLTQPWASLVAAGAKRLETRSWSTPYRGPIAIHAAQGFPRGAVETCFMAPFAGTLKVTVDGPFAPRSLPRGAIVCTATLAEVAPTDSATVRAWLRRGPEHERFFGDFTPGRFAWLLTDVHALSEPVAHRGAQGLRDLPVDVAERCGDAIA
jgi:hypothetical protein